MGSPNICLLVFPWSTALSPLFGLVIVSLHFNRDPLLFFSFSSEDIRFFFLFPEHVG
jgi:hypothetical protein